MKISKKIFMAFLLGVSLAGATAVMGAEAQPRQSWAQEMTQDLNKDAKAAEKEMARVGQELKQEANSLFPSAVPAAKTAPRPEAAKPLPRARREAVVAATGQADPRQRALQGSPETGYAGTWKDTATGDILTSVIAPLPRQENTQNYPIFVEPQINGSSWQASGDSWAPIWNGANGGYQPNGWPQWPGYPGDSGYNPPPPPPPPHMPPAPPGVPPNQPYNPYFPTHNPYNPSWTPFPPPEHPGYRPLRPNNPSIWKPGQPGGPPPNQNWYPGGRPPNQSWQPGGPPPNQSWNPGVRPPNQNWQPGGPPPGHGWRPGPSVNPGPAPGVRPLPMRPGGQTWR